MKIRIIDDKSSEDYANHDIPLGTEIDTLSSDRYSNGNASVFVRWEGLEFGILANEYEIVEE